MDCLFSVIEFPLRQPVAIFLVVLAIILIAPTLLHRIKVPHIVGMIISGMIIGPYGFNILARDASFEIFGQVGILYLMFLAGVEIDMPTMKRNWRQGVVFGLITFILPMSIGMTAAHYILGVEWNTAVLIASMYASHTLISYPIATRFGLSNNRAVIIAVFGTIVAVFGALMVLAEVVAIKQNGIFEFWRTARLLGLTIIYTLTLGFAIPAVTRMFFKSSGDAVTQFIFVLAMVFVASSLASLIGLEPILGAFFAGLVLNRYVPARSALMSRIEFVGNAIFIPYFLIGVGMLINIGVIIKGWNVLFVAANMILTALICKWIAAWLTQKIYKLDSTSRKLIFGLSSGKAAATIAATMVGFEYGLLSEDIMNGAVLMILACCGVASVATERAAIRSRMEQSENELESDTKEAAHEARQLVAVANPMTAESLMRLALYMRHPKNRLPVTALFIRNNDDETALAMGRSALKDAAKIAVDVELKVDEIERYDLNVVTGLTNVLKERGSTDIIIGMHRKSNIVDTFFGSMIEQLLQATNKMVIMDRCYIPVNTITRIVVIVPQKAEYETGFKQWVTRIGNLSAGLTCRVIFIAYKETIPYIRGVLATARLDIAHEYREMSCWDDFIMLANKIMDDDLLVVIAARRTSISFNSDLETMPTFLNRYFSRHNILIVYPEQFGSEDTMPTPIDSLTTTINSTPSPLLLSIKRLHVWLSDHHKRLRGKSNRIDL